MEWPRRQGRGLAQLGVAQVLVDGLAADAVITGEDSLWNTAAGALEPFGRTFQCEGFFRPL
jgi:hypothetical protein